MYPNTFISKMRPSRGLSLLNLSLVKILFLSFLYYLPNIGLSQSVVVVDIVLSVPMENDDFYLEIGPNPVTSDQITLFKETEIKIEHLDVMNSQGQLVFSQNVDSNYIQLENVSTGLFYFRIKTNVGTKTLPLIINEN